MERAKFAMKQTLFGDLDLSVPLLLVLPVELESPFLDTYLLRPCIHTGMSSSGQISESKDASFTRSFASSNARRLGRPLRPKMHFPPDRLVLTVRYDQQTTSHTAVERNIARLVIIRVSRILSKMSQVKLSEIAVGKKYVTKFGDDGTKGMEFLDENAELQRRIQENRWIRWDDVEGSAQDHAQWALNEVRSLTRAERQGEFRKYGQKSGCTYYIHDEETKKANGYGLFKIEGTLNLEPKDLLAYVLDMDQVTKGDSTVVVNRIIANYLGKKKGDPFTAVAYWANNPGFPFHIRDGIDLTSYHKDDDGTMWQMSVSLTGGNYFRSQPRGFKATDRIFGYKLVPQEDGTTKTTLICQTDLGGYIPKSLSNYMVCGVLIDYMKTVEKGVRERKETGEHQEVLQQMELDL